MINVTLPNGSVRQFDAPVSILEVAKNISSSLAKIAVCGVINDKTCDLDYIIKENCKLKIITLNDEESLPIIRHSTAHLLAHAVKELFPSAEVTIGPVIEDGFYYDFKYEKPFTDEDLKLIEKKMGELVSQSLPITRTCLSRDEAIKYFKSIGENYKVEIISSIPEAEEISLYTQGNFTDLCRGPHLPATSKIKAFKLTKVSGAYWRGDSNNEMLQRIYGTAWRTREELTTYLTLIEEAKKRDHRKIGRELDLFHMQDEAPGMVFWHPRGFTVWRIIEEYIRDKILKLGYNEIRTPLIADKTLWEKSGHLENYASNMFLTHSESREYAIKPMNCPCHVEVFKQGLKSYRDLPLRLAEFGSCHRNEPSGSLHGLMRVRNFVQDDAHIFCTEEQIESETSKFIDLVYEVYSKFGFTNIELKLSTRPEKRVGSEELWDKAEHALMQALKHKNLNYKLQPGEGAFYGPKIEFALKDCLNREWQCGTLQLDFNLPERLGASFIDENSNRKVPVMLHRAILGSMERFIGILIEHYAGNFPLWLAPVQVVVLSVSEKYANYAKEVYNTLMLHNIRSEIDLTNETVSYKIRHATLQKVPYMIIIGEKEESAKSISIRKRDGSDLGLMRIEEFLPLLS